MNNHEEKKRKKREYMRDYRKNNPEIREKASERTRIYQKNNPEQRIKWLEYNKEHIKNYSRQKWDEQKQSIEGRLLILQRFCRSNDIQEKRENPSRISAEDLYEIYILQEGKCIYTGAKLATEGKYQISVDRIDPSGSHTKDNCQLVILPINRMKSNMTHDQFLSLLENIRENSGRVFIAPEYESFDSPTKRKIWNLIADMKRRAAKTNNDCHIDFENFKKLRLEQNDTCQLTGVPITWAPKQWNTGSIDRIDSSRGYTMDNVQIVLWPINMMKNDLSNDDALDIVNLIL